MRKGNTEGEAIISFIFSNTQIDKSFYWREIALMAIDPDTQEEKLYAYGNSGNDAEYIPVANESDLISKKVDLALKFDAVENIIIQLSDGLYMTRDEFESEIVKNKWKSFAKEITNDVATNTDYEVPAQYTVRS